MFIITLDNKPLILVNSIQEGIEIIRKGIKGSKAIWKDGDNTTLIETDRGVFTIKPYRN